MDATIVLKGGEQVTGRIIEWHGKGMVTVGKYTENNRYLGELLEHYNRRRYRHMKAVTVNEDV